MDLLHHMKLSAGSCTKAVVQASPVALPMARTPATIHVHQRPSSVLCASRASNVLAAAVAAPPYPSQRTRTQSTIASPQLDGHTGSSRLDILGLGQAMVDFTASVTDGMLHQAPFSVQKGSRRIISVQERHEVIAALDAHGCEAQVSPGGSLANSLVAVSRLSRALARSRGGPAARVSLAGCTGTDTMGQFFSKALRAAGVEVQVDKDNSHHTGTVMVLTTPDAQRSFLSFFASSPLQLTSSMAQSVASSAMVVIEGYMLELPGAAAWVTQVAQLAHATGAQVVLTAGDPSVVSRHRATCQSLLRQGLVDVLFCNREEAVELLHQEREQCQGQQGPATSQYTASEAAAALGALCSAVIVTDGSKGAHISVLGQHLHSVAPFKAPGGPVDVCGAGDAFAAGVLFCLMQGHDMATAGAFAARVAAAVISRHGAQLEAEDAEQLVEWLPDHVLLPSCWPAGSNSSNGSSSNAL